MRKNNFKVVKIDKKKSLFNYEKKEESINNFLMQTYNFEIKGFDKISYDFFPVPNLEISNVSYATQLKNFKFTFVLFIHSL